jgi:hypothetical protein
MVLKTQFEVRFTPLLNFNEVYKPLLSPFLRFYQLTINNGPIADQVILLSKDTSHTIEVRWDNIIFKANTKADLKHSNGDFFHYFDILTKLKEANGFHSITSVLLAEWIIKEHGTSFESSLDAFNKRFFTQETVFSLDKYDKKDSSIVLTYASDANNLKYTFGPFDATKDGQNFRLTEISQTPIEDLKELKKYNGLFIEAVYNENRNTANFSTYKGFHQEIDDNATRIHL